MLELIAPEEKLGRKSRTGRDAPEVAIGKLSSRRPIPSAVAKRSNLDGSRLPAEIQCSEAGCWDRREVSQCPILVPGIERHSITPLRIAMQRSAHRARNSPLVLIPSI